MGKVAVDRLPQLGKMVCMPRLFIYAAADERLRDLHENERVAAARIEALLDVLEEDPGDPRVRRRSVRAGASQQVQGPVWGFTVRGRDTDYLVLWRAASDGIEVRYVGADVF